MPKNASRVIQTPQNLTRWLYGPRPITLQQVSNAGYATLPIDQSDVTNLVTDLAAKAPIANPIFTGDPQAPTPPTADNDTSIATTGFVKAQGYLTSAAAAAAYLPLTGGTITGPLNAPAGAVGTPSYTWGTANTGIYGTPTSMAIAIAGVARAVFSNSLINLTGAAVQLAPGGTQTASALHFGTAGTGFYGTGTTISATISGVNRLTLNATNLTSTLPVVLPADPTNALEAATKQYVDARASANLGRNYIHNALFNIAQRGAGPWTTTNVFTLDRWQMVFGGGSLSVSQVALSDATRTAIGDEAAQYALNAVCTGGAGAADAAYMTQAIENVRRLAGKTVTVSFWAVAAAGTPKLGVQLFQNFGTGGAPSAGVDVTGTAVTLSTTWTRYSVTAALPSASGKSLGSNGNDCTGLRLWQSSGSNTNAISGGVGVQSYTLSVWGVQVEVGAAATPLEKLDPTEDLRRCQRFYFGAGIVSLYTYNLVGSFVTQLISLPVPMRANPVLTPSLTPTNMTGATMDVQSNFYVRALGTATATGSTNVIGTFTASADI